MQTSTDQSLRPDKLFCAVDLVGFPAQAIAAYQTEYQDRALVVVNQTTQSHKCVVISCSPQARQAGIMPGMPLYAVQRRFGDVAVAQRDPALEAAACDELRRVFDCYSPITSVTAHGSGLIDLSRTPVSRTYTPIQIGEALCTDIKAAIPLCEIAIGLAPSPGSARIMARCARPGGICVCDAKNEAEVIAPQEVGMLPGLSTNCRSRLKVYGIKRIAQVQQISKSALTRRFGNEGEVLYGLAHGMDARPVATDSHEVVSHTVLPHDINDHEILMAKVGLTVDKFCFNLKNAGWQIERCVLTLTYSDNKRAQKTIKLQQASNDFLQISRIVRKTFDAIYTRRIGLKSLTIHATQPRPESGQLDLFTSAWESKQEAVSRQITEVRKTMEFSSVVSGSALLRERVV